MIFWKLNKCECISYKRKDNLISMNVLNGNMSECFVNDLFMNIEHTCLILIFTMTQK